MNVIPYDQLDVDTLPLEALIWRPRVQTTMFPITMPITGDPIPRLVTLGEAIAVDVVARVEGRSFCVWWLLPNHSLGRGIHFGPLMIPELGRPIKEETVARRLFPELRLWRYEVRE